MDRSDQDKGPSMLGVLHLSVLVRDFVELHSPAPSSRASPSSIGCAIASCSLSLSSSPSERLMTTHATPLPMRLVSARHSLMNLSIPTRIAIDWIGMSGTVDRDAAGVM